MVWTCADCEFENEDANERCEACDAEKPVAESSAPTGGEDDDDRYKHFVCGKILSIEPIPAKDKLKKCEVQVGPSESTTVTVVTNSNVSEGQLVVVAGVGAQIGEETIKKTNVGGVISMGMICDTPMLGWVGGAAGLPAQIPPTFTPGMKPPSSRPRMDGK